MNIDDDFDQIERLFRLRESGALTNDEFEAEKSRILNRGRMNQQDGLSPVTEHDVRVEPISRDRDAINNRRTIGVVLAFVFVAGAAFGIWAWKNQSRAVQLPAALNASVIAPPYAAQISPKRAVNSPVSTEVQPASGQFTQSSLSAANTEHERGHWQFSKSDIATEYGKLGITYSDFSVDNYADIYIKCDVQKREVYISNMHGIDKPGLDKKLVVIVDGQKIFIYGAYEEDDETGEYELGGVVTYDAPLLRRLAEAKSVTIASDMQEWSLPVSGLASAFASFHQRCELP